jgi:phosphate-selective porin OprO and OprP
MLLLAHSPQGYWFWNRFGLLGEYAISSQRLQRTDLKTLGTVRNTAWQITGSCMLTGETPTYKWITPKRSFDPRHNSWGAFELVGRHSELNVDDAVFPLFSFQILCDPSADFFQ